MSTVNSSTELAGFPLAGHQEAFVDRVLEAPSGARFILIAGFGMGKSATMARLVSRFLAFTTTPPRVMVLNWSSNSPDYPSASSLDVLNEHFVDAPAFRRLRTTGTSERATWEQMTGVVNVGLDFITRRRRYDHALEVPWDLVVVDEAEHLSHLRAVPAFLKAVWASPLVAKVVLAGAPSGFESAEQLVGGQVVQWAADQLPVYRSILRGALQLVDVKRAEFRLSHAEAVFFDRYRSAVAALVDDAATQQRLLRYAEGSLFTLDLQLRRLGTEERTTLLGGQPPAPDGSMTNSSDLELLRPLVTELLSLLDQIEEDSRWRTFESLVVRNLSDRPDRSVLVFVDSDTLADQLSTLLSESIVAPICVVTSGGSRSSRSASETPELQLPAIVITSTTRITSPMLPNLACVIHYDLPTSFFGFAARLTAAPQLNQADRRVEHVFLLASESSTTQLERYLHGIAIGVHPGTETRN